MYMYIYICIYLYLYMYIYIYIYMCIYIYPSPSGAVHTAVDQARIESSWGLKWDACGSRTRASSTASPCTCTRHNVLIN